MSNIDKQAVTEKTKELSSLMVERFSMNPVSCKLLNEAWKKEFPDEVAIANRMLALLNDLEAKDKRISELEAREVVLPQPAQWDISEVLLDKGKVVSAIRAAGIRINGEV